MFKQHTQRQVLHGRDSRVVVWAKDTADGQVKGFLVDTTTNGFTATEIEDKYALRWAMLLGL